MQTFKVTSKGQITIPIRVREKLGLKTGTSVTFEERDGVFCIKKSMTKSPFDKWKGKLRKLKGRKSDQLIKELRGE
jgi:antitoxin PrlF